MEKIKIGNYVRTKNFENLLPSVIGKVTAIDEDMLHLDCWEEYQVISIDDIKKHGQNLIDVIEKGDIVNGQGNYNWHNTIKTVLTKEQYQNICYKEI